tara:strand:- start:7566 stop:8783 length:1218 start_codon:yes stop_codon:yes gene_type:complete
MRALYSTSIFLYQLAINLSSPFNIKAKKWVVGRKKWRKNLIKTLPKERKIVWFHCASLGEFEQGRSVIEAYKLAQPTHFILLTFFSPSGYEIRKEYKGADHVCYLPADTPSNAKAFLKIVKPQKAYFIKYEFWFNYLIELKENRIDTFLISGIFRKKQHFFKWYGGWFRRQLSAFNHFYLQNKQSGELLRSIGFDNFSVCGDTRFDRVNELVTNAKPIKEIADFSANNYTIIAGSTWPKDEELLLEVVKKHPEIKLIIAPHEINASHLKFIKTLFGERAGFFTKSEFNRQVLIVDTIGMLSSIYRYGKWAYIGGGFGSGIHNTLEAVSYGIPVVFGPNYHKFQEAVDLIAIEAAKSIQDKNSLLQQTHAWKEDDVLRNKMGMASKEYVQSNLGATNKIIADTAKN